MQIIIDENKWEMGNSLQALEHGQCEGLNGGFL